MPQKNFELLAIEIAKEVAREIHHTKRIAHAYLKQINDKAKRGEEN